MRSLDLLARHANHPSAQSAAAPGADSKQGPTSRRTCRSDPVVVQDGGPLVTIIPDGDRPSLPEEIRNYPNFFPSYFFG